MAEAQKLISVIIPVYRAEQTLHRTVNSVLRQTYGNTEIILVDDGSPDRSGEICDELAGHHDRIRVIHMDDRGVSAARNAGLREAGGERITFLDADDAMEPDMLEVLSGLMDETGAEIAGAAFRRVNAEEIREHSSSNGDASGRIESGQTDESKTAAADTVERGSGKKAGPLLRTGTDIIENSVLRGDTRVWSKLFDGDLARKHTFREGLTIGEDMLYFLGLIDSDTVYVSTEQPLFLYTINPHGAMERPFTPSYMDQLTCWQLAEEHIRNSFSELYQKESIRTQLASQKAIYAVLTAGKISRLPGQERKSYTAQYDTCVRTLKEQLKIQGCFASLSAGYKVKAVLLNSLPGVYRLVYGRLTGNRR